MNINTSDGFRVGIGAVGAYVPMMRLQRKAIEAGVAWAVPGVKALAKGERSVANWDEDSVTMAVEAARDCLTGIDRGCISRVALASTTLPFSDRSNSGIIKDALNLSEDISNSDMSGSRRAGTTALIDMLNSNVTYNNSLLLVSDCREAKPGSNQEMLYGHGAAALLLEQDNPVAIPVATASLHRDLVDQYRYSKSDYDYPQEERWVRVEGYLKIVPDVVQQALAKAGIRSAEVNHFILPCAASIAKQVASKMRLENAEIADPLISAVGDCGTAHSFLMLAQVLKKARCGETILLVGFGQGADALIFRVTESISSYQSNTRISEIIHGGRKTDNYVRYLVIRNQLLLDFGARSERDNRTALSAYYRKRDVITGFNGGRCGKCGALQFPKTVACVICREFDTQSSESLAELTGSVKSFTEDWLGYTPSPPLMYGNITFPGGGNVMMEFADFATGEVEAGMDVRMSFRIKDYDSRRDFRRYFWKAVPQRITGDKTDG